MNLTDLPQATLTESILQGTCELVERHVCALADKLHPAPLPARAPESTTDPVLRTFFGKVPPQRHCAGAEGYDHGHARAHRGSPRYEPGNVPGHS